MDVAPFPRPTNENITKRTRRQIWLQIYLPIGIGTLVLAGLGTWAILAGFGTVSVWADVSLMLIIVPAFVIGLLVFAVLIAMTYGLFRLLAVLPEPIRKFHSVVERVGKVMGKVADLAVWPVITMGKVGAALKAFWRVMRSLL